MPAAYRVPVRRTAGSSSLRYPPSVSSAPASLQGHPTAPCFPPSPTGRGRLPTSREPCRAPVHTATGPPRPGQSVRSHARQLSSTARDLATMQHRPQISQVLVQRAVQRLPAHPLSSPYSDLAAPPASKDNPHPPASSFDTTFIITLAPLLAYCHALAGRPIFAFLDTYPCRLSAHTTLLVPKVVAVPQDLCQRF